MRVRWLLGLVFVIVMVSLVGCGGKKLAPVSGTVTLNGKPLAKAVITFMPVADPGSIDAGVSSGGKTNENGEFTLKASDGKNGALVGKHKVSISQQESRGEGDRSITTEKLPKRYNENTELTYDVPSSGTDKANFELKSP